MEIVPVPTRILALAAEGPGRAGSSLPRGILDSELTPVREKRRPLPNFRNGCDDARGVPLP